MLRGLAILGVIAVHTLIFGTNTLDLDYRAWAECGVRGVQLFFLISAFSLFLNYERRQEEEKYPIRNFYVRRVFRIVPMYWLACVAYGIWEWSLGKLTASNFIAHLFFLQGFSSDWLNRLFLGDWTLATEAPFYILAPLLFILQKRMTLLPRIILAVALVPVAKFGADQFSHLMMRTPHSGDGWGQYIYYSFPTHLPVFLIGCLAYVMALHSRWRPAVLRLIAWSIIIGVALFEYLWEAKHGWYYFNPYFSFSMAGGAVLVLGWLGDLDRLCVRPLLFIGRISYSLYLSHIMLFIFISKAGLADPLALLGNTSEANYLARMAVMFLIAIPFSYLTYIWVEVPGIALGARLIRRWEPAKER